MLMNMLRAVWRYRGFILGSVKREFQSKYLNSMLGAAWTVLNPLSMILVYTLIFSQIMRAKLPGVDKNFAYSIYLCAGVMTWGLFVEIVTRCQSMFLDNANLIKKLNFPRLCLPVTVVINSLINFGIVFGLFTAFLLISGNFPGWVFLAILPLLLLLIFFAVGLGIILGILNVFFRDVGQFFSIFLTFWFWLTPIVYLPSILPETVKPYIWLNPLAPFMEATQGVLLKSEWPDWINLVPMALIDLILCAFAIRLFRRRAGEMVDEL